jgi:DNA polymerase I-like protein with 3'-5' exonuclease and polymerase domains
MIYLISRNKEIPGLWSSSFIGANVVECGIDKLIEWLSTQSIVACDTETTAFEPQRGDLLTVQMGDADNQFIVDTTTVSIEPLKVYLESPDYTWIFHNGKFDWRWFKKHDIEVRNIWDTFLAECLLTAGYEIRNLGLDAVAWKYCEAKLDKSVRGEITHRGLTSRTIKYCADDVTYLHKIREKQLEQLTSHELLEVMALENKVTNVFAECEYNGIRLNTEKWLQAAEDSELKLKLLTEELDQLILGLPELRMFINKAVQTSMFGYVERPVTINYASPTQIMKLIAALGFETTSTNAKDLEKLDHPFIAKFIEYKKQQKLVTTYGKEFLKNIRPDGTISTQFFQIVDTGRVSSGDKRNGCVNLQNIPATETYRTPFIAADDEVLICADFTAMEAVVAAEVSNEQAWVDANNEGLDLHSINAEMAFGKLWQQAAKEDCEYYKTKQKCKCSGHKVMRDKIKTTTYLYLFGGGAGKLSKQLNIPLHEAKSILQSFSQALPNLQETVQKVRTFAKTFKYMRTLSPFRRKRFFENFDEMYGETKDMYIASVERQSFNFYIQGSSADCTKLAMCLIKAKLLNANLYHKFNLQVHDEIIISTRPDIAEQVKSIVEEGMIEAGATILKKAKLGCSAEISKYWKK